MKLTDKQKRENIRASVKYWQEYLNLQNWEIILKIKNKTPKNKKNAMAYVNTDAEYKRSFITFYTPNYTSRDDVDEYIVHEYMHILLSDYDHLINDFAVALPSCVLTKVKENTAETLTRIIHKAHKRSK